jgi:hypothetical protein
VPSIINSFCHNWLKGVIAAAAMKDSGPDEMLWRKGSVVRSVRRGGKGSVNWHNRSMTQLAQEVASHVWPVYKVRAGGDGQNMEAVAYCGTGFIIEGGFFLTCWHCVSGALDAGEAFAAVYPAPNSPPGGAGVIPLRNLSQSEHGADLALAKVDSTPLVPRLTLASKEGTIGDDVYTVGYPLLPPPTQSIGESLVFEDVNPRFLRGYITQIGGIDLAGRGRIKSIEVDMLVPPGLSGAPLIRSGTLEILGVLNGNHGSYSIDTVASVEPSTGVITPEVRSLVTLDLRCRLVLYMKQSSPAIGAVRLDDIGHAPTNVQNWLVEMHGQQGWVATRAPLSVDGMIVAASTTAREPSASHGCRSCLVMRAFRPDNGAIGQRGERTHKPMHADR